MVTRRRARGYTMLEIAVTLALFGVFLFIIVTMTAEMRRNEKKWPVDFFANPEVGGVLARIRRDVYDSISLPPNFQTYDASATMLISVFGLTASSSTGALVVILLGSLAVAMISCGLINAKPGPGEQAVGIDADGRASILACPP